MGTRYQSTWGHIMKGDSLSVSKLIFLGLIKPWGWNGEVTPKRW